MTGRSLQEYLRARLIELAEKPDAEAWVARVRQHQAQFGESLSLEEILAYRDADRP